MPPKPSRKPVPAPSTTPQGWTSAHTEGLKGLGSGLVQDYQNTMGWLGTNVGENPAVNTAAMLYMLRPGAFSNIGRWKENAQRLGKKIALDSGEGVSIHDKSTVDLLSGAHLAAKYRPGLMSLVKKIGADPELNDLPFTGSVPATSLIERQPEIGLRQDILSRGRGTVWNNIIHELVHVGQGERLYRLGGPEMVKEVLSNIQKIPYSDQPHEAQAYIGPLRALLQKGMSSPNLRAAIGLWNALPQPRRWFYQNEAPQDSFGGPRVRAFLEWARQNAPHLLVEKPLADKYTPPLMPEEYYQSLMSDDVQRLHNLLRD